MTYLCPRCKRFWAFDRPDRSRLLTGAPKRLCPNKQHCAAYAQPRRKRRR